MGKYFTVEELCRSQKATELKIDNTPPNPAIRSNIEFFIQYCLDPIRDAWGKPIYVSSGFRCNELNHAVGGARNSQHLIGMAADLYVKGVSNAKLIPVIVKTDRFDQLIIERGDLYAPRWIHVSYSRIHNRKQILFFNGKDYKDVKYLFVDEK